jgi:hypothetical protein
VVGRDDPIPLLGARLLHRPLFDDLEDAVGADRLDELVDRGPSLLVFGAALLLAGPQLLERAVEEVA